MGKNDNLPPGVNTNDIPGNSQEDIDFEEWYNTNLESLVDQFIEENPEAIVLFVKERLMDDPCLKFTIPKLTWPENKVIKFKTELFQDFLHEHWLNIKRR